MSKTVYKYFFDFLDGQAAWLNRMAGCGYRLKKCGRLSYCFDACAPGEYEYAVEFVGEKSFLEAREYRAYLERMGFRAFTKAINLNFSFGKARWRPYAKAAGRFAASPGGFNKELIILEKKKDDKPLELHTGAHDKLSVYKTALWTYGRAAFLVLTLSALAFIPGALTAPEAIKWATGGTLSAFGALLLIPTVRYAALVARYKKESAIFE